MRTYHHIQPGWAVIAPMLFISVVALGMGTLSAQTRGVMPSIAGSGVLLIALFATLTVTVADSMLQSRFRVGLVGREIRLSDVRCAEAVRNRWYCGWGIRLTQHGWPWNVSGLDAVELTLASGKRFRIGTDEPGKLLEAIHSGMVRTEPSA